MPKYFKYVLLFYVEKITQKKTNLKTQIIFYLLYNNYHASQFWSLIFWYFFLLRCFTLCQCLTLQSTRAWHYPRSPGWAQTCGGAPASQPTSSRTTGMCPHTQHCLILGAPVRVSLRAGHVCLCKHTCPHMLVWRQEAGIGYLPLKLTPLDFLRQGRLD